MADHQVRYNSMLPRHCFGERTMHVLHTDRQQTWFCLFLLQHRHMQPCMVLSLLAPPQTHATMHGVVSSCSSTDTCSHAWCCLFLLHHRHMQPCMVLSLLAPTQTHAAMHGVVSSCSTTDTCSHAQCCLFLLHHRLWFSDTIFKVVTLFLWNNVSIHAVEL